MPSGSRSPSENGCEEKEGVARRETRELMGWEAVPAVVVAAAAKEPKGPLIELEEDDEDED